MRRDRVVQLLECDPSLGDGLTRDELEDASESLPAQKIVLKRGKWRPGSGRPEAGQLGYLIVDGLLVRRVLVGEGSSVELLGHGELLRPWQEDASSFCTTSWEVMERSILLHLGPALAQALARWPVIASNLVARGIRRSRALAADAAIASIVGVEQRLLVLLWHIGETWGEVEEDGVRITIRLPHRLLAELVGARRPSVTSALAALQEAGRVATTPDGSWVLRGDPPR